MQPKVLRELNGQIPGHVVETGFRNGGIPDPFQRASTRVHGLRQAEHLLVVVASDRDAATAHQPPGASNGQVAVRSESKHPTAGSGGRINVDQVPTHEAGERLVGGPPFYWEVHPTVSDRFMSQLSVDRGAALCSRHIRGSGGAGTDSAHSARSASCSLR